MGKGKRILVASVMHESNSFNPIIAGEKDFKVMRGEEILNNLRDSDSISGIIRTLQDNGCEVVPVLSARAVPNGEVNKEFYLKIKKEIVESAAEEHKNKPLDAVTLALHGSMRVHEFGEAEGPLLEELRAALPGVPIYAALDMHTTMTQKMYDNCDGFTGYKCAPHTDCYETGVQAAELTIERVTDGAPHFCSCVRVPILIAGEQSSTTVEPMKGLRRTLLDAEKQLGIKACSYLMGFPWADNEDSSCSVCVVADSKETADSEAVRLADILWEQRNNFCFQTETYHNEEALNVAMEAILGGKQDLPVYLSDSGDNPTAGSSSDCTGLLQLIMEDPRTSQLKTPVLYGGIYDPEAVRQCKGKVGERITLTFGAAFDKKTSRPITAEGTVMAYIDDWGKWLGGGGLVLFRAKGVDIVLAENHIGYTMPEVFSDLGRDPREAELVVCKLGYLTDAQSKVAKRSIMALSAGSTNEDLKNLHYEKIPRPIFPIDEGIDFNPQKNLF